MNILLLFSKTSSDSENVFTTGTNHDQTLKREIST